MQEPRVNGRSPSLSNVGCGISPRCDVLVVKKGLVSRGQSFRLAPELAGDADVAKAGRTKKRGGKWQPGTCRASSASAWQGNLWRVGILERRGK